MFGYSSRTLLGSTLLVLLFVFGFAPALHALNTPHLVYGPLETSEGTVPDNDDVALTAYIESRPNEVLTDLDPGCGYKDGQWRIEVGNFETPWAENNILFVEATNRNTEESESTTIRLALDGRQLETGLVVPPGGGVDDGDDGDGSGGNDGDSSDNDSGETNSCFIQTVGGADGGHTGYGMILAGLLLIGGLLIVGLTRYRRGRFWAAALILALSAFLSAQTAEAATKGFTLLEGYNAISVPLGNAVVRVDGGDPVAVETAGDLISAIGVDESDRNKCRAVLTWDDEKQRHVADNEDKILPGQPILVEMAAGTEAEIVFEGPSLPAITNIPLTAMANRTHINFVAVPFYRTDLDTAEKLADEIPNCDTVWRWDRVKNGYDGHPAGTGINNFEVVPGRAYYVNVKASGQWHQGGGETVDTPLTVAPNERIAFMLGISQETLAGATLPLSYKIIGVEKNDVVIFDINDDLKDDLPEGAVLDRETGEFTWTPGADQMGRYDFFMVVEDVEGELIQKQYEINVFTDDELFESPPAASPVFIDPSVGEQSRILLDLAEDAEVTIDLYKTSLQFDEDGEMRFGREPAINLIGPEFMQSGRHNVYWDGQNAVDEVLEPGLYTFIVTAETDDGRLSVYGLDYAQGDVEIRSADVSIVDSEGVEKQDFNPYAGDKVRIAYTLDANAWVTIGGADMNGYALEGAPRKAGDRVEMWDGRNTDGIVAANGAVGLWARGDLLPENAVVIVEAAPSTDNGVISDVTADPYVMTPAYGDVCAIRYTVADPDVQRLEIAISDTHGNRRIYKKESLPSTGSKSFLWNGTIGVDDDAIVWSGNAAGQEDYAVEITAFDEDDAVMATEGTIVRVYR